MIETVAQRPGDPSAPVSKPRRFRKVIDIKE